MVDLLRVLVVDDMALYRKLLSDLINEIPGVEVVGTAPNGKIALDKISRDRPDVVTLDIEMPVLDGLETLRVLKTWKSPPKTIVVSAHTREGAEKTMEALDAGACEFITKPDGGDMNRNRERLQKKLHSILTGLAVKPAIGPILIPVGAATGGSSCGSAPIKGAAHHDPTTASVGRTAEIVGQTAEIVAIAVSTGGPKALGEVIPRLPGNLPVPVVVVLHIPMEFTAALVNSLDRKSAINVKIGEDRMALQPGTVYFAPGGKQMKIEAARSGESAILRVTDDPPENYCRPSADYLMRSVAVHYGGRSLGVIMTGMGDDGVQGLRLMKGEGATIVAQDEESSVVFGMPLEAIMAGIVDLLAPLSSIPHLIVGRVTG